MSSVDPSASIDAQQSNAEPAQGRDLIAPVFALVLMMARRSAIALP
jgi:hypothetical protein